MTDEVQPQNTPPAEAVPADAPVEVKPVEPPRKIATVGEIPFSGSALARALFERGLSVRVLCPDEKAEAAVKPLSRLAGAAQVEIVRGDFDIPGALEEVLKGAYGVCYLSPINMHGRMHRPKTHVEDVRRLVEAAQNSSIRKLVYHSAIGAHPESQSQALKQAAAAEEVIHASKCEDFRIRTGPLMGRGDGFLSEMVQTAKSSIPFMKIFGYGSTTVQPLHVADMARCLVRFFVDEPSELSPGYYTLAGPETTTLLDLIDSAAQRAGHMKIKFHVPLFVLQMISGLKSGNGFKEQVSLLFDAFASEQNDAPRLLKPGEKLITPQQTQEEILTASA